MDFVLGKVQNPNMPEERVPVLFNGAVRGGSIRDPWGHPFRYRIMAASVQMRNSNIGNLSEAAFAIPNINRIPAEVGQ